MSPDSQAARPPARPFRIAVAPGLSLAAEVYGNPTDQPVILAHGGGQTRHAWGGTARDLAEAGFYAVSIDMRGHGDSDWAADGDYRLQRFVEDLIQVAGTFPRAPAVVGASLGGLSAMLAAGELAPEKFSAVVLVDIAPRVERGGSDRILDFMRAKMGEGFATLDEAADAVASYATHRPRPKDLAGLAKNLRRRPDGRWRWHWDPRFIDGASSVHEPGAHERLKRAVANLAQPAMLVRGRLSDVVSDASVAEFRALNRRAQFVDIAQAGHMVAGDRNDAFTQAVVEFLSQSRKAA